MSDKEFWIMVRRALLMVVDAIERKWQLGKYSKCELVQTGESDSISVGV